MFLFRLDLHGRYLEPFETPERLDNEFALTPLSPCVDLIKVIYAFSLIIARIKKYMCRINLKKNNFAINQKEWLNITLVAILDIIQYE